MNSRYFIKRLGQGVLTIFVAVTITFGLIRLLSGSPEAFIRALAAGQGSVGTAYIEQTGVATDSSSILEQYVNYVVSVAHGDLGTSIYFGKPVAEILIQALPWTVLVISIGLTMTFAFGIVLGAILAYTEGSRFDVYVSTVATILNSIPYYVIAIVMLFVLGYQLEWFPISGRAPVGVEPGLTVAFISGVLYHAALPIASIVIAAFGFRALAMRGNSIQVLGEDYVRVANLRGLSDRRIALEYVGRNAVLPMYTGFLIAIGFLLGSSVVLEAIFQYQGIGFYLFRALSARDYPLMMGAFLVITTVVAVSLFVADITYGLIDPRASTSDAEGSVSGTRIPLRYRLVSFGRRLQRGVRGGFGGLSTLSHRLGAHDDDTRPPTREHSAERRDDPAETVSGSLFETTAETTLSRKERYYRAVDEYVLAPLRIIKEDPRALVGATIVVFYLLVATVGVWLIAPPEPNQGPRMLVAFETLAHPLGTTAIGADILSQVVHSTPAILKMMLAGALFATVLATIIGLVAGYSRGFIDRALMQICDIALTIPGFPLVIVLAVIFEPSNPYTLGILLTINAWGGIGRQIRSQVLAIGRESYVEASGIMSLGMPTILVKDLLPNIMPFVFIKGVQVARQVIIAAVALAFLGIIPLEAFGGINWGVTIRLAYENGALYTFKYAFWILAPVIAIVLLIYGLILLAQGMDRIFNPRVRARHAETAEIDQGETPETVGPNRTVRGD